MNSINIIGNLTADPTLTELSDDKKVAEFRIAAPEYPGSNKTVFITVNAWGKLGENVVEYLKIGDRVAVSGRLSYSEWEKDAIKMRNIEITAAEVLFPPKK